MKSLTLLIVSLGMLFTSVVLCADNYNFYFEPETKVKVKPKKTERSKPEVVEVTPTPAPVRAEREPFLPMGHRFEGGTMVVSTFSRPGSTFGPYAALEIDPADEAGIRGYFAAPFMAFAGSSSAGAHLLIGAEADIHPFTPPFPKIARAEVAGLIGAAFTLAPHTPEFLPYVGGRVSFNFSRFLGLTLSGRIGTLASLDAGLFFRL